MANKRIRLGWWSGVAVGVLIGIARIKVVDSFEGKAAIAVSLLLSGIIAGAFYWTNHRGPKEK